MHIIILALTFLGNASLASEPKISKAQFSGAMIVGIPKNFCAEKQYFRQCFKITEEECLKEATRAAKICLMTMDEELPSKLQQPTDVTTFGTNVGSCAGTAYDFGLRKKKIVSLKCDDPSKWK